MEPTWRLQRGPTHRPPRHGRETPRCHRHPRPPGHAPRCLSHLNSGSYAWRPWGAGYSHSGTSPWRRHHGVQCPTLADSVDFTSQMTINGGKWMSNVEPTIQFATSETVLDVPYTSSQHCQWYTTSTRPGKSRPRHASWRCTWRVLSHNCEVGGGYHRSTGGLLQIFSPGECPLSDVSPVNSPRWDGKMASGQIWTWMTVWKVPGLMWDGQNSLGIYDACYSRTTKVLINLGCPVENEV